MKMEPATKKVEELLELRLNGMLAVNPEYQRGEVWTVAQKKKLIDSVLRGYPLPLIYLHHIKKQVGEYIREDFEVIDGQQRMNALHDFREGAFKLFDPVKDEAEARFPAFVKDEACPWGGMDFEHLDAETRKRFLDTPLSVAMIETNNQDEARDLFIRLQAGMPLNPQEKRDAWPGNFTEFILKVGGKPEIARYPGHDFFTKLMGARSTGRGKVRQVAAQIAMLFFRRRQTKEQRLCDIHRRAIDDFYYENLAFDAKAQDAVRFVTILDKLVALFGDNKRKKLLAHEAIHLVLFMDGLLDDYTPVWEEKFAISFDRFRENLAKAKLTKNDATPSEYWMQYGQQTRVNSDRADTIKIRHEFFVRKMLEELEPTPKDPKRRFGTLERELIYMRDGKRCAVCDTEVVWDEAEIHHVKGHAKGGKTHLSNGVLVHSRCHPKGRSADEFAMNFKRTPKEAKRHANL